MFSSDTAYCFISIIDKTFVCPCLIFKDCSSVLATWIVRMSECQQKQNTWNKQDVLCLFLNYCDTSTSGRLHTLHDPQLQSQLHLDLNKEWRKNQCQKHKNFQLSTSKMRSNGLQFLSKANSPCKQAHAGGDISMQLSSENAALLGTGNAHKATASWPGVHAYGDSE